MRRVLLGLQRTNEPTQHFADGVTGGEDLHHVVTTIEHTLRKQSVGLQLLAGALSDPKKLNIRPGALAAPTLGYVCWDGSGRAANLRGQPEQLIAWKVACLAIAKLC